MTNTFMARAIQLSLKSVQSGCGGPFGAVIMRKGEIIAEGVNQVTARNDARTGFAGISRLGPKAG